MPRRNRRLPLELTDIVIDHLHNDIHALKACSLVCKAWSRTARLHLFDFPVNFDQRKLTVLLRSSPSSINVAIVPQLRNISLWGNSTAGNVQFWDSLPFSRLSASFRSLKTLRFHDIPWHRISPQARSSLITPFVAVQVANLHLSAVTENIIPYVVSAFPSLKYVFGEISSQSKAIAQDSEPSLFGTRIPVTLRTIQLTSWGHYAATIHAVLRGFLAFGNLPPIHTIALHNVKTVDYDGINQTIAALGPALQTFICKPAPYQSQSAIDFSSNISLSTVRLGVVVEPGGTPWITQTLLSIRSPLVHTVSIVFYHSTNPVLVAPRINWDAIDDIFARPMFSSLAIVHLHAPGVSDFWQYLSLPSAHRLPKCHARGLLRFDELDEFGRPDVLFMRW